MYSEIKKEKKKPNLSLGNGGRQETLLVTTAEKTHQRPFEFIFKNKNSLQDGRRAWEDGRMV